MVKRCTLMHSVYTQPPMMWLLYFTVFLVLLLLVLKVYCKLTYRKCTDHTTKLTGKVALITGANCGIGYETARGLASRGAKVILAGIEESKTTLARDTIIQDTGNYEVIYKYVDLSSFKSVRKFAQDILKTETKLDILINNAGVGDSGNSLTEDNIPIVMQVNYFGPFLLTTLLLPLLLSTPRCRVINVASILHWFGSRDFSKFHERVQTKGNCSTSFRFTYSNSKLAIILFTTELAKRLKKCNGTANSLHPGVVMTDIFRKKSHFTRFLVWLMSRSAWEGAQTSIYLAVSDEVEGVTGRYYCDCKESLVRQVTKDETKAKEFWEYSENVVNNHNNTNSTIL